MQYFTFPLIFLFIVFMVKVTSMLKLTLVGDLRIDVIRYLGISDIRRIVDTS